MALDTGWSERPAMLAAVANTTAASADASRSDEATSLGLPSVMVPVLSSAIALSLRASSR